MAVGSVRMMSSISIRQLTAPSGHLLKCSVTIPINETDGLAGKVAFDDLSLQPFGIINDAISSRGNYLEWHICGLESIVACILHLGMLHNMYCIEFWRHCYRSQVMTSRSLRVHTN